MGVTYQPKIVDGAQQSQFGTITWGKQTEEGNGIIGETKFRNSCEIITGTTDHNTGNGGDFMMWIDNG